MVTLQHKGRHALCRAFMGEGGGGCCENSCVDREKVLDSGEGHAIVHVQFELGPVGEALRRALVACQKAGGLVELLLVALQVAQALGLKQVKLLLTALVQADLFGHVRVEAEVGVGRQQLVQHSVYL